MSIRSKTVSLIVVVTAFIVPYCGYLLAAETNVSLEKTSSSSIPRYTYRVIAEYPHAHDAFTQGLVYEDGTLYEGTGLYGKSALTRTELETGIALKHHHLPARFFGEGITIFGDRIIQLTWRSNIGFVYDKDTFQLLRTFHYATEGWGITHDGGKLIMSDGTANLYFLDPHSLKETGRIEVTDDKGPVTRLNELEYVLGEIYANVWPTSRIAKIDPKTGTVKGWIDLEGLVHRSGGDHTSKTLNGIAYDVKNKRLFVTGKLWSKIYEIKLVLLK